MTPGEKVAIGLFSAAAACTWFADVSPWFGFAGFVFSVLTAIAIILPD